MLDRGVAPAGAFLAGIAASVAGAPVTVAGAGVLVMLLAALLAWRVPGLRQFQGGAPD